MKLNHHTLTQKYIQQNGGISKPENALLLFYADPDNRYKDEVEISKETGLILSDIYKLNDKLKKKKLIE